MDKKFKKYLKNGVFFFVITSYHLPIKAKFDFKIRRHSLKISIEITAWNKATSKSIIEYINLV